MWMVVERKTGIHLAVVGMIEVLLGRGAGQGRKGGHEIWYAGLAVEEAVDRGEACSGVEGGIPTFGARLVT